MLAIGVEGWMWWFAGAAFGQEPMWYTCRPKATPLEAAALFDGALPKLRPAFGDATPIQSIAGHRLVVSRDAWVLDGAPVTELPKLDAVVMAVAADLPAADVARLFQALLASGAKVWSVHDAAGKPPAGMLPPEVLPAPPKNGEEAPADAPPGTIDGWNRVLSHCGPGKVLVQPSTDCSQFDATWKAVTEAPRCVLPSRMVRDVRAPVGAGSPTGVAVEVQVVDATHDSWLKPEQTWSDLEAGAGWAKVGPAPWGDGPPEVTSADLVLRDRVTPPWPDKVPKGGRNDPAVVCDARVAVDAEGATTVLDVKGCDGPFADVVRESVAQWRWHAPVSGGFARTVHTRLRFRFQHGTPGAFEP